MDKPESDRENEAHQILWDFAIETNRLILVSKPQHVLTKKKAK